MHNGSSLFTGDAGQGESNIRRWIIEKDWLEAIVALPLNMFYNTGIATCIWVLTNRKPEHRRGGKVQLIDATQWFKPLRKNLGKKNCELSEADIQRICDTFLAFEETEQSKILAWELLGEWLQLPELIDRPDADRGCWFWPHLPGGVEPDVVLKLGGTVVVVEAKYRSGRHDLSLDEEYEEKPVDQILRQYNAVSDLRDQRSLHPDALERAVQECQLRQAFLVDARKIRRARWEYHESRERLPDAAKEKFVLLTWQELYSLLLKPGWSRRRWAADVRTYLEDCGLASFQGIRRDVAEADQLARLSEWRPVPTGLAAPQFDTAAAHLSYPKFGELRHWHPLVDPPVPCLRLLPKMKRTRTTKT